VSVISRRAIVTCATVASIVSAIACGSGSYTSPTPTAPSASLAPAPAAPSHPTLRVFQEVGTGFSTTDLYDVEDEALQLSRAGELIWGQDGTRFPGYAFDSRLHDGVLVHWISGPICPEGCSFEVRFGTRNGDRRAYLTIDYGHWNLGTLVDVEPAGGALVATLTEQVPPGSPTVSGSVWEQGRGGRLPVAGAIVGVIVTSGWQEGTTDSRGFYRIPGVVDATRAFHVRRDGFVSAEGRLTIRGDTVLDVELVRK
jgi:hypothetical protein